MVPIEEQVKVDSGVGPDILEKQKISGLYRESNCRSPIPQSRYSAHCTSVTAKTCICVRKYTVWTGMDGKGLIPVQYIYNFGRDSSVGIATLHGLDGPGI